MVISALKEKLAKGKDISDEVKRDRLQIIFALESKVFMANLEGQASDADSWTSIELEVAGVLDLFVGDVQVKGDGD